MLIDLILLLCFYFIQILEQRMEVKTPVKYVKFTSLE
jgi:hypothetical protein